MTTIHELASRTGVSVATVSCDIARQYLAGGAVTAGTACQQTGLARCF